ncbi:MAG: hypothetical protein K9M94_04485 [Spirochaetia bacterium]|nr:hypothetical protein [Spirochaetia bacterium]
MSRAIKTNQHPGLFIIAVFLMFIGMSPQPITAQTIFDWGGFADSSSELRWDGEADYQQDLEAGIWLNTRFSENASLRTEAKYQFNLDRSFFADLSQFVFTGTHPVETETLTSRISYRLGRFNFADFTGYVLDHNLDGSEIEVELPWGTFSAGAGYTGLTFVPNSRILLTQSDIGVHLSAPSNGYATAPPKTIERLALALPQLLLEQDVSVSIIAQQDLQQESDLLSPNDRIFTEYLGLGIAGSMARDLYHRLYGYFNYGHGAYSTLAYLAGGELTYYMEDFNYSRLKLSGVYSSGDPEQGSYYGGYSGSDYSNHFIPLSHREQFGIVFSPSPGNLSVGEFSYSIKPLSSVYAGELQIELSGLSFIRSTTGAISEPGVSTTSDQLYLGSEADLRLKYRPFSDLGITLSGGVFMPNNYTDDSPFSDSRTELEAAGRLNISFTY